MTDADQAGFPWGNNDPTRLQRALVGAFIASVASALHFFRAVENGGRSDFAPVWHAGRLLLDGQNPYLLIGPGNVVESAWPMFYPATTFVFAIPFAMIPSFHAASTVFVFLSAFLLVYGATARSWHLLPMFPSIAFLTSATLAQWSILMTAAIYVPWLNFFAAAKPQSALPVLGSTPKPRVYVFALAGAAVLLALSFALLPTWPRDWWRLLGTTDNFVPPVMRFGGPVILLVLLLWRRPEAWLVLIAACMPQTWPPYNGLMLMAVAMTYREACFLSLVSSFAWAAFAWHFDGLSFDQERTIMSAVLNLSGYIPATILILRRPNEGKSPVWIQWLTRAIQSRQPPGDTRSR